VKFSVFLLMTRKNDNRPRNRTTISFHGDEVEIRMPTTTLRTTRDTMARLGVCANKEIDNVQEYTVRRVLDHARSGALLTCAVRAHALYHGLIEATDPAVETVRLDIGGQGFELSKAFLMDTNPRYRFSELPRVRLPEGRCSLGRGRAETGIRLGTNVSRTRRWSTEDDSVFLDLFSLEIVLRKFLTNNS
jgi:hypothetical protein